MLELEKCEEVDVHFLKNGAVLSGILFDDQGQMLWPARKPVTDSFIFKLKERAVKKVYYVPPKYKSTNDKEPIFTEETQSFAASAIEEIAHQISYGKMPDVQTARLVVERLLKDIQARPSGFLNLQVLKQYDTYTYSHSINVGILSMFLTKKLGFNMYFIQEVGLGGFLHDIGKIKISSRIVNKATALTEDEFRIMKSHPIHAFNLIKDDSTISNYVKKMVLFHHERWDGSGYPLKLKGEAIGNFAGIISVSDVYDALTTERPYKKPYSVNDALLYVMRNTMNHFNPFVSQRFVNEVSQMYDLGSFYPKGAFVLLNTGETACIIAKDSEYSMRPEIAILKNFQDTPLRTPLLADLKIDVSRVISKTIDEPEEIEKLSMLL